VGQGIGDVLAALRMMLPPWALILAGVLIFLWAAPGYFSGIRIKQIRTRVRKASLARGQERDDLIAAAFERAGDDPERLLALADEAKKRRLGSLAQRALDEAAARGASKNAQEKIRVEIERPRPNLATDSLEVAVRIEGQLDNELWVGAREQLNMALARWPSNPELQRLKERLDAEMPDGYPQHD